MEATSSLRPRRLLDVVRQRMAEEPVVILTGPRTVGKSTLLAGLGRDFDRLVFDLDSPEARAAAAADPGFLVSGPEPVLIDEFQHVPEILDAVKAELNRATRPGRFVLTGSTRYTVMPQAAQSLTGRAHVINVLPLSQGELYGHREHFVELLWEDPERVSSMAVRTCARDEYVNRILAGGFPMILQRQTTRARTSWFADYVDLVVMRDVLDIARVRQREALPRLLRQLAAQTGQLLNITKAGQAAGLESSTANRYATLLEAAFMVQRLPAWGETLGKRLTAHPKVHVIDSGLGGWLLGLSATKVNSRNPAALTEFGHLVETFAVGEILKQVSWSDEVITASHFHTEIGDEVDLVLETWDGRVAGFEIKAGTRIKDPDLSGLRLLRDRLGDRFVGGFVLNLGDLAYRKEDKIAIMPLCSLWSLSGRTPSGSHACLRAPACTGTAAASWCPACADACLLRGGGRFGCGAGGSSAPVRCARAGANLLISRPRVPLCYKMSVSIARSSTDESSKLVMRFRLLSPALSLAWSSLLVACRRVEHSSWSERYSEILAQYYAVWWVRVRLTNF